METLRFNLVEEADAYTLSRYAREQAEALGIMTFEAAAFANAISEIAMNAIVHGRGGAAEVHLTDNQRGIEAVIGDNGPGIGSLAQAFTEGHSTAGTLGLGLSAAHRACEDFSVLRNDSSGTTIALRQYLHVPTNEIDYDVVSLPAENSTYNKDIFLTQESRGDTVLVMVADLGAFKSLDHNASQILREVSISHRHSSLEELGTELQRCLGDYYDNDEVHFALLRISPFGAECHVVGNAQAACFQAEKPTGELATFTVIASDGVDLSQVTEPIVDSDAYTLASQIFNQSAVPEEDATVLVVRRFSNESR
nr:ATP-binding protein [Litorivivens lipolytica]